MSLEILHNRAEHTHENEQFRRVAIELRSVFIQKNWEGILIGNPFNDNYYRFRADAILCYNYGIILIDFKDYRGTVKLPPNDEEFHNSKWYTESEKDKTYRQIAEEMMCLGDAAVMSAKKDALVNMGGFLAVKDADLAESCKQLLIITEGFATYGGLAGRDMEAIAVGLQEVFDPGYLNYRIVSTRYLGENIKSKGVNIIYPVGGHAVYVDAKSLYPHIPPHEYPGQALVCELYRIGGLRSVEIGSVMFGKYDSNGKLIPAPMELVRLAVPRRVYTQSHIDYVIEIFDEIVRTKDKVKGLKIVKEPQFLRHFTAHFEPL